MAPITPHFQATFAFNAKGEAKVVDQGSEGDLLARAKNVAVCAQGFREELPEFGIPQLLFKTIPLPIASVKQEIAKWAELDLSIEEHEIALEAGSREVLGGVYVLP